MEMEVRGETRNKIYIILIILILLTGCIEEEKEQPRIPSGQPLSGTEQVIGIREGWNLVSMPNETSKYNVSIKYNGEIYTWTDAVTRGYILDFLYGYEDKSFYLYDVFLRYKGYWLYSYVDCNISEGNVTSQHVIRCAKLIITNESEVDLVCDILIIAPEYYNTEIECNSITITDKTVFIFGGDVIGE